MRDNILLQSTLQLCCFKCARQNSFFDFKTQLHYDYRQDKGEGILQYRSRWCNNIFPEAFHDIPNESSVRECSAAPSSAFRAVGCTARHTAEAAQPTCQALCAVAMVTCIYTRWRRPLAATANTKSGYK